MYGPHLSKVVGRGYEARGEAGGEAGISEISEMIEISEISERNEIKIYPR